MKRIIAVLLAVSIACSAHAYLVSCDGVLTPGCADGAGFPDGGGAVPAPGLGPNTYGYWVTLSVTDPLPLMNEFTVGWYYAPAANFRAYDLASGTPLGWTVSVTPVPENANTTFAPDGIPVPATSLTPATLSWTSAGGAPVGPGNYWFGYDSYEGAVETGWQINLLGFGTLATENWSTPIGGPAGLDIPGGDGPVHVPIPEPTTVALVLVGAGALILRRRFAGKK